MTEVDPVAERAHQIDYIRHRVANGDLLYSAYTVQILLDEIAELSERCLGLGQEYPVIPSTKPLSDSAQAFVTAVGRPPAPSPLKGGGGPGVQRCQAQAFIGTGHGTCNAVLVEGYCPRWGRHIEED